MNKRISNLVIFTLILLSLVFILSVSANAEIIVNTYEYNEDFSFSSNNKIINTCSCGTFLDVITLKNTGDKPSIYTISVDNDNVNIYPKNLVLSPKESASLMNYIKTPCNEKSFDFSVYIETTTGLKKAIKQEVNVQKCQNLVVAPVISNATISPCETAKFRFLINNTDGFTETYDISINRLSNYAKISENPVVLESFKSKIIDLAISPACDIYGTYDVNLNIKARNNKLETNIPLNLNILQKYDFSLDFEDIDASDSVKVCNYEQSKIDFTIKNNADIKNNYSLEFMGPEFIKLEQKKTELGSKEEETLQLTVNPTGFGDFNFVIKAVSVLGDLTVQKNISLKVEDCYPFDFYIANSELCSNENNYLVLENKGEQKESIQLKILNPGFSKVEEEYVTLSPGEKREVLVKMNSPDKDATYKLEAEALLINKSFSKKTSSNVKVTDRNRCYAFDISPRYIKVDYSEKLLGFALTNRGTRKATYTLLDAEKPNFLDIDKFGFALEPGEKKEFDVISVPILDQTKPMFYKVKFNVYISEPDIAVKKNSYVRLVRCDYIAKLDTYKVQICLLFVIFLILLFLFFRMIRPKAQLSKSKKKRLFLLRTIATIIAVIVFFLVIYAVFCSGLKNRCYDYASDRIQQIEEKKAITVQILNESIIETDIFEEINETPSLIEQKINETLEKLNRTVPEIITIPIDEIENKTSPLITVPEKPLCENYSGRNICGSSLYIKWNKNTQKTIDLSKYFTDPDQQNLTFSSEPLENISTKIEGSIVTLTPDKDFYGVREQIFSASDSEGGQALSDIFVLHLESKDENLVDNARSFAREYRYYFVFALILLFILIALYFFMKSERD